MLNQEQPAESTWLKDLREGGEKGFVCIYNAYFAKMLSIAYNYTRSEETAQELVQDVFTNLWLQREKLQIHTNLKAYLFTAMRNKVYDYLEKQTVRKKYEMHVVYNHAAGADTTNHEIAYKELYAQVEKELTVLPETTQKVFRLSREEGLPVPQIAQELQLSGKAVEYHLTKALKHLRLRLMNLLVWGLVLLIL
ncbi:RNA polymerase sigma-70 factor [soil metagenome]